MASESRRPLRPIDLLGGLCVVATLLLTSAVDVVRAEDGDEAIMSVDPALVAEQEPPMPQAAPSEATPPRIVHLNVRGYNYGAGPGGIDPAAMRVERAPTPPAAPSPTR